MPPALASAEPSAHAPPSRHGSAGGIVVIAISVVAWDYDREKKPDAYGDHDQRNPSDPSRRARSLRASSGRSVEEQIRDPDQDRRTHDRPDDDRPGPDAIGQERSDVVNEQQNDREADDAQDFQDDDADLRPAGSRPVVAHVA